MNDRPITLISGTRKGIGKHLAQHYLSKGHIVIGCSRSAPDWQSADYHHFLTDVSNETQVVKLLHEVGSRFSRLDNLINNAGIASMNHSLLTPMKTAQDIIGTNFLGTFLLCREAARLMRKRKYGRIVNFSSVATPLKLAGEAIYAASKAAVVTLTQVLAKEFSPLGITVNAVGPGPIETDLIKNVPKEQMQRLLAQQAINRMGNPEDVANVTDFFLAPASSMITGQTIYLGGV